MTSAGIGRGFEAGEAFALGGAADAAQRGTSRRLGLSARLLLITLAFVALAEILIFVPAVAAYRREWLSDRIMAARVAATVLDGTQGGALGGDVAARLLAGVGARSIALRARDALRVMASDAVPDEAVETIDLRRADWPGALLGAWRSATRTPDTAVRVIGPGRQADETVEVLIDEAALQDAVLGFALPLLSASLAVTTLAGALVFALLRRAFVRPMRRLSHNIAAFAHDPENAGRVIVPSGRGDEIGEAEAVLARMEIALAGELRHKRRLAGLGLSVSKISHELRNLLTTAQLLGDRLERVEDPVARRVAPRLVATLDRANRFCEATLAYGRAAERHPRRQSVPLAPILAELPDLAALSREQPSVRIEAAPDLLIDADPEQLARILGNLVRNAVQALDLHPPHRGDPCVVVAAHREEAPGRIVVTVTDNGPGLPRRAREHLFEPFQGAMRSGSTGLGLAIAAELAELNGGTLSLEPTEVGARFRLVVPDLRDT